MRASHAQAAGTHRAKKEVLQLASSMSSHWRVVVNSGNAAGGTLSRLAGSLSVAVLMAATCSGCVTAAACRRLKVRATCSLRVALAVTNTALRWPSLRW